MARRYGGKHSPGGHASAPSPETARAARPRPQPRVSPTGARSNVLFFPAIVLLATTFFSGATTMALGLTGAGLWTLGAWLTREGLKAEDAYWQRKVAKRPAIPRKIFGALLFGAGGVLAGLAHGAEPLAGALYAVMAALLHLTAFGPDPLRDKGLDGVDQLQQDRVARVVDEAERYLSDMAQAAQRTRDRHVEDRVARFGASVRDMIRTVEEDPRDLTGARRYLGVYLMGARDATVTFADIQSRGADPAARADYLGLLDDMEENYAAKTRKLLSDSNADLAIEIEVLRDRLDREGARLGVK